MHSCSRSVCTVGAIIAAITFIEIFSKTFRNDSLTMLLLRFIPPVVLLAVGNFTYYY